MENSEEKKVPAKYYYYDYHERYIAREEVGNNECASNRFEFYLNGEWINDYDLSLSLSDATRGCCGCSFFEYEELTEEEAMRRISESDKK
ncbi:MAG: hypothetical protein K2L12_06690 [Clostridia bacterium]|nr:hypothetical protein [Clostridia bacterium]